MSLALILSSYIPFPLAARILQNPETSILNRGEQVEAVALFADMAGFTPLAEALGDVGPEGTEQLTTILNRIFTPMVEEVQRWGGVVGKFAGDAMTVLFPGGRQREVARRALACAWSLQQRIRSFGTVETLAGPFTPEMKLGLAAGQVLQMVSGNARRAEFILAGPPLDGAAAAEHRAAPGEIILHPSLGALLEEGDLIAHPLAEGFLRLEAVKGEVSPCPLPPLPQTPDERAAVEQLRLFFPVSIYERLASGQELLVNEHRRTTVLFVAFAGIDYEAADAVERLGAYLGDLFAVVERFGGHICKVEMGDKGSKALLLFGAPVSYENDEERALLCALALQQLAQESPLVHEQHIGMSSGRVFVGNVGAPWRQEYTAIGDTVNLAARLMQAAGPDKVLVGESCYGRAAERFHWEERGTLLVKGRSEPVRVWELTGRRAERTLYLQEPHYALPMVGRQEELAHLTGLLERVVQEGRGRVVGLVAEAGMGKSRLAAEVIGWALSRGFAGYGGYGLSHGTDVPYLALRPLLRGLLEVEESQPVPHQVEALSRRLAEVHPNLVPRLPLLGDALGLPIADNDLTASFDARLRRESLFSMVVDLVRHRAVRSPLLLVIEDAHWLDDLSIELVRHLARNLTDIPAMLLTVYRPPEIEEAVALWMPRPEYVEEIRLGPFSPQESAELIRLRLAGRRLPETMVQQIEQHAQGNPFFVDEFLSFLLERGENWEDPHALETVQVPESLERLIISRIDQLAESEKTTLRVASVIGRLFRARWLLGIYPGEIRQELILRDLERLSTLGLTPLERHDPELEYLFKHALTREVAYQGLSFSARRMLHERIANYIEASYAGELEAWYGVLAYHYHRTGRPEKEFQYLCPAADRAAQQSAHRQAAALYDQALALAEEHHLGTPEELFALHEKRFRQYNILGQYERLMEDAAAMERLAGEVPHLQVKALIFRGEAHWRMETGEAAAPLEAAVALARQCGDRRGLLDALYMLGRIYWGRGEYAQAQDLFAQVIAEAGEEDWRPLAQVCLSMGWIAYDEGDYARCEHAWKRALELAQAHGAKPTEALALNNLGCLYNTLNRVRTAIEHAERGLALAQEIGYTLGEAEALLRIGEFYLQVGQYKQALSFLEKALAASNRLAKHGWGQAYIRNRMAETILEQEGDLQEAARLSQEALELGRDSVGPELLGWLYHTVGEVARRIGNLEEAQRSLERSACLRRELAQWATYTQTLAALGEVYLEQGALPAALEVAQELLGYLCPPSDGEAPEIDEVAAAWTCSRILREAGWEGWQDLLARAYSALQRDAACLETEELRRSFLENVPLHRQVVEAYTSILP